MSAAVTALRRQLEELVPAPPVGSRGVPTGIAEFDALLPMGGLPRGKLTEIRGKRSSGITTVLRHIITTVSRKGLVAYVDAGRTLAAGDFVIGNRESGIGNRGGIRDSGSGIRKSGKRETGNGKRGAPPIPDSRFPIPENLWVIRPPVPSDAPWCADVLLRSGAFALVVLDGAPALSRSTAARLIRLARESGTALVVAGEAGRGQGVVGAAVRVSVGNRRSGKRETGNGKRNGGTGDRERLMPIPGPRIASPFPVSRFPFPASRFPDHLTLTIEKGGIRRGIEVEYAIGVEDRLCAHPEVGDRRGIGKGRPGFGIRDSGLEGDRDWGLGIGSESEFGRPGRPGRPGNGKRETGNGDAPIESGRRKRRKAGHATSDSSAG